MTTKTTIIETVEFGEPPATGREITKHVPRLLKEKPGHWAKVRTGMSKSTSQRYASRVNCGGLVRFPPDQFEALARKAAKGDTWDLWMRYLDNYRDNS